MQAGRGSWLIAGIDLLFGSLAFGRAGTAHGAAQTGATKTIRATAFVIKDDAGRSRARLATIWPAGEPELSLFDEEGVRRVELAMWKGVPILTLSNGTSIRAMLTTLDDAMPTLSEGMAAPFGASGITLHDDEGQLLATLGLDKNTVNIDLSEESDRVLVTLCKLRRNMQLILFRETGFDAPPCANLHIGLRNFDLMLYDKNGVDRTTLMLSLFFEKQIHENL